MYTKMPSRWNSDHMIKNTDKYRKISVLEGFNSNSSDKVKGFDEICDAMIQKRVRKIHHLTLLETE